MHTTTEPQLKEPGAGLPAIELFLARRLFARKLKDGTREGYLRKFAEEWQAIRLLVSGCDRSRRGERVLIKRLRGLEDSSRYWSVWMTLDHLRITNLVFSRVIDSLAQGQVPERKASTADVKPDPDADGEVEETYEKSCDRLLATIESIPNLRTEARYAHPWFGPLDASGWHALAAMHMGIHRGQIEKIVAGLGS